MIILSVCACGPQLEDDKGPTEKYYADGVKLISKKIDDPRDPSTFTQNEYTIGPSSRLLIRLESLKQKSTSTVISDEKRMYLVISSEVFN